MIYIGFSAALLAATPALAQQDNGGDSARFVSVRYGQLDLSRTEDAELMLDRLQRAAVAACQVPLADASVRRAIEACEAEALEDAVARLNEPEVTRVYQGRQRNR
jgi:UrcA family protein